MCATLATHSVHLSLQSELPVEQQYAPSPRTPLSLTPCNHVFRLMLKVGEVQQFWLKAVLTPATRTTRPPSPSSGRSASPTPTHRSCGVGWRCSAGCWSTWGTPCGTWHPRSAPWFPLLSAPPTHWRETSASTARMSSTCRYVPLTAFLIVMTPLMLQSHAHWWHCLCNYLHSSTIL